MRILFVATGDIALPTWDWLLRQGHQLVALITQPDKPVGRHQILTPPEVKVRAEAAGVPVMQPASLRKKSAIDAVADLQPDLVVVMAYGQILNERFLAIPRLACINIHASLLPRYRGAACIQAAIDKGDKESGVSVMHRKPGDLYKTNLRIWHPKRLPEPSSCCTKEPPRARLRIPRWFPMWAN